LREGYVFNGSIIHSNLNIHKNIKQIYGFDDFVLKKLHQRIEFPTHVNIKEIPTLTWGVFINFISQIIPSRSNTRRRILLNIFILDLITSYRG
jgi:hypothetical protein